MVCNCVSFMDVLTSRSMSFNSNLDVLGNSEAFEYSLSFDISAVII